MNLIKTSILSISLALCLTPCYSLTKLNILTPIEAPMTTNLVKTLKSLPKDEPISIEINSPGGSVDEMHKVINELKTHSNVSCNVNKYAASAAANILMSCKHIMLSNNAVILFHIYQTCNDTMTFCSPIKTSDFGPLDFGAKDLYTRALAEYDSFRHIFTAKEWEAIASGKNIIIMGWDLKQRLTK